MPFKTEMDFMLHQFTFETENLNCFTWYNIKCSYTDYVHHSRMEQYDMDFVQVKINIRLWNLSLN